MARSGNSVQLILLSALCIALAACAFLSGTILPTETGTLLPGLLLIAANAVPVLLLRRKFAAKSENIILSPLLFTLLVLTSPYALYCHSLLISSILLTFSILLNIRFSGKPDKQELFVFSMLILETSALFWTPVLWLCVPYLLTGILRAEKKIKFTAGALLTIFVPVAIYLAVMYLDGELSSGISLIQTILNDNLLSLPEKRRICFSMPTLIKYIAVSMAVAISVIRGLFQNKNSMKSFVFIRIQMILLLILLIAICVLFYEGPEKSSIIMLCPFAAIFLNDYISGNRTEKESRLYLTLLTVIIICERISTLNINLF